MGWICWIGFIFIYLYVRYENLKEEKYIQYIHMLVWHRTSEMVKVASEQSLFSNVNALNKNYNESAILPISLYSLISVHVLW